MPYRIKKCNCKDSKGKKGKYIVTKKGKNKQLSCHTSKAKAKAAIRARHIREISENEIKMVAARVFEKLLYESSRNEKSLSGSHPDESYELGWQKFDEKDLDKKGITTWDEDREWTKQYFKSIGLM